MAVRIDVRMLGRPHVVVDDAVAPIVGRQLLLTLRLAVAERVPISLGRLVDDVWPDGTGTEGAARVGLTRLRNVLGHDAIVRAQSGYTLAPEVGVDAERFEQLLLRGRDRSLEIRGRVRTLDEALAEWRGQAFEDVESLDWVESVAVRLDELREHAVDLRFELRLVDHEPASLVPELRSALDRCPTRERRAEMLALALYRAGTSVRSARGDLADAGDAARPARAGAVTGVVGARDEDPASGPRSDPHRPRAGWSVGRADGFAVARRGGVDPHRRLRGGAHDHRRHDRRGTCRR